MSFGGSMKYQLERIADIFDEAEPMFRAHYKEVYSENEPPFSPDIETYEQMCENNRFRAYTARSDDGILVGYCFFFLARKLRSKECVNAHQDSFYISKDNRGFGEEFLSWCDEDLRKKGVTSSYQYVKDSCDFSPMLNRLGYEYVEKVYCRRLN